MILPVRNYDTVTVLKLRPTDDISWLGCIFFQIKLWDLWRNCNCVSKAFRFLAQTDIVGEIKQNKTKKKTTHTLYLLFLQHFLWPVTISISNSVFDYQFHYFRCLAYCSFLHYSNMEVTDVTFVFSSDIQHVV